MTRICPLKAHAQNPLKLLKDTETRAQSTRKAADAMCDDVIIRLCYLLCYYLSHKILCFHPTPTEVVWEPQVWLRIINLNINILFPSNNKQSSHICVLYDSEDVYIVGKLVNCDLTLNWALLMSVAGQLLYPIQRCRPVSANHTCTHPNKLKLASYKFFILRPTECGRGYWCRIWCPAVCPSRVLMSVFFRFRSRAR